MTTYEAVGHAGVKFKAMFGLGGVGGGLAISFDPRIEIGLRILSLCIGIVVGIVSLVSILRSMRAKATIGNLKVLQAESELCQNCRQGQKPAYCPLPEKDRPPGCPHFLIA